MVEKALEKLESQFKAEKDPVRKQFARPILEHLKKRCREDEGLCEDILQEHKTWNRLYSYITQTARKHINGNAGAVLDSTVFEWAEDYYRKDDKAEVEKEKKKAEQKKKSAAKKSQKPPIKADKTKAKPNTSEPKKADSSDSEGSQAVPEKVKQPKQKTKKKETEGQMSIFDFLGGGA